MMNLFYANRKYLFVFGFIGVIFVASALRLAYIHTNPSGFFCDEAANGLNAYSIIRTARDQHGTFLPLFFKALGDFRDPTYIYTTAPLYAFFAPSEFTVRFGSALYGIGTVIIFFFLVQEQWGKRMGLLASLLLAVNPWHIHYSRAGFQLIASVFWILMCMFFWNRYTKKATYISFLLFFISGIAAFFSYFPTKIVLPLFGLFLLFLYYRNTLSILKSKGKILTMLVLLCTLLMLMWPYIHNGSMFSRWHAVSEGQRTLSDFIISYANHFDYGFLFLHGEYGFSGSFISRQSLWDYGEFHQFQAGLILIGVWGGLITVWRRSSSWKIVGPYLMLLALYPLSSAFTTTIPSATHSIVGVIPLTFFTAYGVYVLINTSPYLWLKRLVLSWAVFIIFISTIFYITAYLRYPIYSADINGWQYGYREALIKLDPLQESYNNLYISHRYNAGESLLQMYKLSGLCNKCRVMGNPIVILEDKKEIFAARLEDIYEAESRYPHKYFLPIDRVQNDKGGLVELYIGTFEHR